jgi:hypothetical protein
MADASGAVRCLKDCVDVLGFATDDHVRLKGADWLNAIESAAGFIRALAGAR